jgi:hypothetical protein
MVLRERAEGNRTRIERNPKGLKTKEGTGESRDKGPKTNGGSTSNGYPKTSSEQSWRLAIRGRFMATGYAC